MAEVQLASFYIQPHMRDHTPHYLYKSQIESKDDKNIIDEQEKWIIDNCTPLFFIEKAADILQNYIRNFNIEKMLIKILNHHMDIF